MHLHRAVHTCRNDDAKFARLPCHGRGDGVGFRRTLVDGRVFVEVSATLNPREVVDFVEHVVVVEIRVVSLQKILLRDGFRRFVALGDEVVAVVAVRISRAHRRFSTRPTHGAVGVEKTFAIDHALRHFLQIVGLSQVGFVQHFGLQMTAVAIDFHLAQVAETAFFDEFVGDLIDARLSNANFRPSTVCQHRIFGISTRRTGFFRTFQCLVLRFRLDFQHKTHQNLMATLAIDERLESDAESAFSATLHHHLLDFRHFR